nr:hypothetical protein [Providencia alcalifaciens]
MSNEIKFDADILLESVNAHGADGHVYNDTKKRVFNGAQIHTSPVVNIDTYLADGYIQTVNSVYRIVVWGNQYENSTRALYSALETTI